MNKLLRKFSVLIGVLSAVLFAACGSTTPSGGGGGNTIYSGPTVNIYVSTLGDATNLYESIAGVTNDVYIVGDLGGMTRVDDNVAVANWDPTSVTGVMTKVSANMYKIALRNNLTNNAALSFKFVNGTPGYGGAWANQEDVTNTSGGGWQQDNSYNRGVLVAMAVSTNIYFTNTGVNAALNDTNYNGIPHWDAVGPTYTANATVTITVTNANLVGTFILTNGASIDTNSITNGTPLTVNGFITNAVAWQGNFTNISVVGNAFTFTVQQTIAAGQYQITTPTATKTWSYDNGGNINVSILPGVTSTNLILNNLQWRFW
jgi:hypothetical protein